MIVDLQRRIAERGRIRLGVQAPTRSGKSAPKKLDRFRFTSSDPVVIDAIAARYGGQAKPWDNGGHAQHEVITDARDIPIMLPPSDMAGFNQFYEAWAKGFATRRCTGEWDFVSDSACDCDPENRTCKMTTRLSVILTEVPGLGVWRLESHGYYAAVELGGAVELLAGAAAAGRLIPARLLLEDREVRRLIQGKAEVRQFVVPVIDVDLAQLPMGSAGIGAGGGLAVSSGAAGQAREVPSLPAPGGWRPVDQAALPDAPFVSIADQLAEVDPAQRPAMKARKNAAAPIKATGRAPRTAKAAAAAQGQNDSVIPSSGEACEICRQSLRDGKKLVRNPVATGAKYVHADCARGMEEPADATTPQRSATSSKRSATQRDRSDTTPEGSEPAADEPAPEVVQGELVDIPASQGGDGGDRGGTAGGPTRSGDAEPGPVTSRLMSHSQHKMVFSLAGDIFSDLDDDGRRTEVLALCAALGRPGLTSRTEIDAGIAPKLIDALVAIQAGDLAWVDGELLDGDGELIR